jgi:phage virion morphogenesis protein
MQPAHEQYRTYRQETKSMITVEFNDRGILDVLRALEQRTSDLTPALQDIGEYLTTSTKDRFASSTAPNGTPWGQNSDVTLSRKRGTKPLIGETRRLSNEFNYFIGNNELTFGSSLEYAAVQQFGADQGEFGNGSPWGDIPARPFIGISDDDQVEILDIINSYLASSIT